MHLHTYLKTPIKFTTPQPFLLFWCQNENTKRSCTCIYLLCLWDHAALFMHVTPTPTSTQHRHIICPHSNTVSADVYMYLHGEGRTPTSHLPDHFFDLCISVLTTFFSDLIPTCRGQQNQLECTCRDTTHSIRNFKEKSKRAIKKWEVAYKLWSKDVGTSLDFV